MRRKARPGGGKQHEVVIESLGGRGDGIASLDGDGPARPVFVPATVPGDRVRLRLTGERGGAYRGAVVELLEAGPGRVAPPCPHFGPCGGCALQHWEAARYADWKAGLLDRALARRGLADAAIRPMVRIAPGTRRRADLVAKRSLKDRSGDRVRLGFRERASHAVVDLETCLLLTPGLVALLPPLRAVLGALLPAGAEAQATVMESEAGLDLLLALPASPDLQTREALAGFAERQDLARLACRTPDGAPEPIALRRPPQVTFGGVPVVPPPGGFLQPSAAGEAALTEALLRALPDAASPVADLYAGCGTFSFAMAAQAARRVHAVEGDAAALSALQGAAQAAGLAARVSSETRDLERRPLSPEELKAYAAVVFDPPRAGAKSQAEAIARSAVPWVVAVSCNPNTFARDARILVDGGFALLEATPIDQFPWSGHLELVALFRR